MMMMMIVSNQWAEFAHCFETITQLRILSQKFLATPLSSLNCILLFRWCFLYQSIVALLVAHFTGTVFCNAAFVRCEWKGSL